MKESFLTIGRTEKHLQFFKEVLSFSNEDIAILVILEKIWGTRPDFRDGRYANSSLSFHGSIQKVNKIFQLASRRIDDVVKRQKASELLLEIKEFWNSNYIKIKEDGYIK